ncbi:putative arf-GAP with GTPase [Triplophysa rosa]|uniref:Arf-GAP with GTPase n=1 Tax=Triplophysa rosa TaxID=992332 RepID=A0A9W7W9E5_TRIRA|nr:putative arf-GAP with GTPase [Triplophysa rosa]
MMMCFGGRRRTRQCAEEDCLISEEVTGLTNPFAVDAVRGDGLRLLLECGPEVNTVTEGCRETMLQM